MSTQCPKCGNEIPALPGFCAKCGWSSGTGSDAGDEGEKKSLSGGRDQSGGAAGFCKGCGGKLEPGHKFCPECGTPVGGRKAGVPPKRAAAGTVDGRKYDEAVRMGREVEEWSQLNDMGPGCLDPIAFLGGPPIAGLVFFAAAAKWHELWYFFGAIAVLWLVAAFWRMKTRALLGARDIDGAKKALQTARLFSLIVLLAMAAALVDFWIHVDSCAKKYDKKLQETADEISRGLNEASRRLQR